MKLLSSVGMQTWELTTAAAIMNNVSLCFFLPVVSEKMAADMSITLTEQFGIDKNRVEIIPIIASKGGSDQSALMRLRDEELLGRADLVLPISISPDGNMSRLIKRRIANGKDVMRDFQIEYEKRSEPLCYRINPSEINTSLGERTERYLVHWTRAGNSAWPGERLIDYYRDVISSSEFPRSALATLRRILQSGTILATKKNMPAGIRTVSFSALSPATAISLMRWRPRYRQMSFEPYGIGITKESAIRHGLREVRYVSDRQIGESDNWLIQSRGKITDWSNEKEYRHLGDLDLSLFDSEELVLFSRTEIEAKSLARTTGLATVSMTREKTTKNNKNKPRTT